MRIHGATRCAVHFEQLGPRPNSVFFHCDQIIRSLYAPFAREWLAAFSGTRSLLFVRTEDVVDQRRPTLARVWKHLGLASMDFDAVASDALPVRLRKAEARLPSSYVDWTKANGPIQAETISLLTALFRPYNQQLRELLDADGTSCGGAGGPGTMPSCDGFLWDQPVS